MSGNPTPTPSTSKNAPPSAPPTTDRAAGKPSSPAGTRNSTTLDLRSAACAAEVASGAHGDCVKALQLLLAGYGLHVTVDGQFGEATVAALKAFQSEAGIAVNGKADAETKKLLYGMARGPVQVGSLTVTESVDGASVARCLDAHTTAAGEGGPDVQVWTCNGTAVQKWALHRVPGRSSQYLVVNQGNHRCLDADLGTVSQNGQRIRAVNCNGLSAQRWRLGASGPSGGRTLVSVPDGFCLDAEATSSGKDGQPVQGFGCAGSTNQVWSWS
ncbi:ricin-type beta-trefoil lectin domain protein [Streptomyces sp. WAC00263]|uniref:ricin-type beta-trefoil lectin domain protein n=1 Tax=Streptomyces sp. WAC00263 TaxID=1917422 RepID=UPI001F5091BC|nr:ricin-type beta-trefoil lectin domain protein [Streptomyces sp. WAC00263]